MGSEAQRRPWRFEAASARSFSHGLVGTCWPPASRSGGSLRSQESTSFCAMSAMRGAGLAAISPISEAVGNLASPDEPPPAPLVQPAASSRVIVEPTNADRYVIFMWYTLRKAASPAPVRFQQIPVDGNRGLLSQSS